MDRIPMPEVRGTAIDLFAQVSGGRLDRSRIRGMGLAIVDESDSASE